MTQIPILFFGDSPSLLTGLGRIGRELALHVASLPQFRVGFLGRGGLGSRKMPFAQYVYPEAGGGWGETAIEQAWKDFAGASRGIIFSINDPTRMTWFSQPYQEMGKLYEFLTSQKFARWGYFPVDATGPGDRLTAEACSAMRGYDRVLAYSAWASTVLEQSMGRRFDYIPHGLNFEKFQPRGKAAGRIAMGASEDDVIIGVNMTNQVRKDWGIAFATLAAFGARNPNVKMWVHTDVLIRHWSIPALAADFGVENKIILTYAGSKTDEELSYFYSACDLTLLPSSEGFGYPIAESLACGVPVLHGAYGGGAELVPRSAWLIPPATYRIEGIYNAVRPVWEPSQWTDAVNAILGGDPVEPEECRSAVEHLSWANLWPSLWRKWFENGVEVVKS